jgi:hypothetical protein
MTQCPGCTPACTLRSACESQRENEASEMTSYQWTVASALYQLRWEPSERRGSAVSYLHEVISKDSCARVRSVAMTLLSLAANLGLTYGEPDEGSQEPPDENSPADKATEDNYHGGFYS